MTSVLFAANQPHIDKTHGNICNILSAISQVPPVRRRGADGTDWLVWDEAAGIRAVIHSPEMETDSLAVFLSGVVNVTDR